MREQVRTNSLPLAGGENIGVPNQGHILNLLKPITPTSVPVSS